MMIDIKYPIQIAKQSYTREDIAKLPYKQQLSVLSKIWLYINYLKDWSEYIDDIASLSSSSHHTTWEIDFGEKWVDMQEVLSFLNKLDGRKTKKIS